MEDLARPKVDNVHAVVTQFGDEQSPPGTVDRHVINAARDVFERDCSLQDQRWTRRCRADGARDKVDCRDEPKGKTGDAHGT